MTVQYIVGWSFFFVDKVIDVFLLYAFCKVRMLEKIAKPAVFYQVLSEMLAMKNKICYYHKEPNDQF